MAHVGDRRGLVGSLEVGAEPVRQHPHRKDRRDHQEARRAARAAPGAALVLALTAAPGPGRRGDREALLTDLPPVEDRLWLVIDVAAACVTCPSLNIWPASLPESHSRATAQAGIAGAHAKVRPMAGQRLETRRARISGQAGDT
jgi:hypothetical protein